jgi:hypothetical protein
VSRQSFEHIDEQDLDREQVMPLHLREDMQLFERYGSPLKEPWKPAFAPCLQEEQEMKPCA